MIHQDASVSYPIAKRLKALGWPQDGVQMRYSPLRNGDWVLGISLEFEGKRPPKPAAPAVFAVLTSEWLRGRGLWWSSGVSGDGIQCYVYLNRQAGEHMWKAVATPLELLEKILDAMEA